MALRLIASLLCLLAIPLGLAEAQNLGTIRGTVTDRTGAALPGATVTLTNEQTNGQRTTVSDNLGNYDVPYVEMGTYTIRVEVPAFKPVVTTGFILRTGVVGRADFTLELGALTAVIEVRGQEPLVRTDTGTRENIVSSETLKTLPNQSRNWTLAFRQLMPNYNQTDGLNGVKIYSFAMNLNGADVSSPQTDVLDIAIPLEAVEQVKINTNAGGAEAGFGAVQVSLVTKRGTNDFHGSVYEYYRSNFAAARPAFAPGSFKVPWFNNHQFGSTFGGPVLLPGYNGRDKTFFFTALDSFIGERGQFLWRGTSPTDRMRQADFSEVPFPLRDPFSGATIGQQAVFSNNVIPSDRVSPLSQKIWELLAPLRPNQPGIQNNLVVFSPRKHNSTRSNQLMLRADHTLGSNDFLTFTFNDWFSNASRFQQFAQPVIILGADRTPTYSVGGQWVHTFNSRWVLESNVMYRKQTFRELSNLELGNIPPLFFQITGLQPPPGLRESEADITTLGGPHFLWGGTGAMDRLGAWNLRPSIRDDDTKFLAARVSHIFRSHIFRQGAEFKLDSMNPNFLAQQRGQFNFVGDQNSPFSTGWAMADFLLGIPASVTYRAPGGLEHRRIYKPRYALYWQDDWKAAANLTLTSGVRWEYTAPITERDNRLSMFDLDTRQIIIAGDSVPADLAAGFAGIPVAPATSIGLSRSLWTHSKKHIQPRVGLAWRPFGGTRSVVRGGYGIYYQDIGLFNQYDAAQSAPLAYTLTARTGTQGERLSWNNLYPPASLERPGFPSWPREWEVQRYQQWNVTLEREIGWETAVSVGYVGTRNDNSPIQIDGNFPAAVARGSDGRLIVERPLPEVSGVRLQASEGYARNHSLQIEVKRRLSGGLIFDHRFTWGKQIDNGLFEGGFGGPLRFLETQRGISSGTRAVNLVSSFLWETPIGQERRFFADMHPVLDAVVGGWTLTGIVTARSGLYFNPTFSNTLTSFGLMGNRPDVVPAVSWKKEDAPPGLWFNPAAFKVPDAPTGTDLKFHGTAARNFIPGPGFFNVDLTISKFLRLYRNHRLELRAEAYNVFNRLNLAIPETNISIPATVGRVLSAAAPNRTWQFAMRYQF